MDELCEPRRTILLHGRVSLRAARGSPDVLAGLLAKLTGERRGHGRIRDREHAWTLYKAIGREKPCRRPWRSVQDSYRRVPERTDCLEVQMVVVPLSVSCHRIEVSQIHELDKGLPQPTYVTMQMGKLILVLQIRPGALTSLVQLAIANYPNIAKRDWIVGIPISPGVIARNCMPDLHPRRSVE